MEGGAWLINTKLGAVLLFRIMGVVISQNRAFFSSLFGLQQTPVVFVGFFVYSPERITVIYFARLFVSVPATEPLNEVSVEVLFENTAQFCPNLPLVRV